MKFVVNLGLKKMACPRVSHVEHKDNGNIELTFEDGSKLTVPPRFQADCNNGTWTLVPILTTQPPTGS